MNTVSLTELELINAETGDFNAVIETPRGSRNKFAYDPTNHLFKLKKVLPAGAVFPFDFGFFPGTQGEDGDPLDVLIFMEGPVYPGVLLTVRLIGAIEAEQSEEGKTERNDRLIAVASEYEEYRNVKELTDINASLVAQIEHFFVSYNQIEGRKFKPLGRPNARQAKKLVDEGRKRFAKQQKA